jgi:hypothetical protein
MCAPLVHVGCAIRLTVVLLVAVLRLHYYQKATYQGHSYNTLDTLVAATNNNKTRYGKLVALVLVEAEPKHMHVAIIKKLRVEQVQFTGVANFTFPKLICKQRCDPIASVAKALTNVEAPVCLSYTAIRPVKAVTLALDTMIIVDV